MLTDLDLYRLAPPVPRGLAAPADAGSLTTGTLVGLDAEAGVVQVVVGGSDPITVPAAPGCYDAPTVRLLRSQLDGGRVVYCLGPTVAGPQVVAGVVTEVGTDGTLTVSALGQDGWAVPYVAGTYNVGTAVHVLRGPYGDPAIVLGPSGQYAGAAGVKPPAGASNGGGLVTRTATIRPDATGSYGGGHWGWWNSGRYGRSSTLYQGQGYGSPAMVGLAVYGQKITALRASRILSIRVTVQRADSSTPGARTPVLQCSPNGSIPSGAPAVSGGTVSGPGLTPGAKGAVALTAAMAEALRTGAARGLAMVGGQYAGFYGTAKPDGMALYVTYQVTQ